MPHGTGATGEVAGGDLGLGLIGERPAGAR